MKNQKQDRNISQRTSEGVFSGGGEMGELMRSIDWSNTPVGHPSIWPQSLRTSVDILLASKQLIFLW